MCSNPFRKKTYVAVRGMTQPKAPPPPPQPAAIPPPPPPPAAATAPDYAGRADRTNTDEEIRKRTGSATNKRKRGKSSLRIRQSGGTSYPGY